MNRLNNLVRKKSTVRLTSLEALESRQLLTSCPGLCGDANSDGSVNMEDFLALSVNFGGEGGLSEGDFDGNGTVGFKDFLILSDNFGKSIGAAHRITPEKVVEASQLIKSGKRYSLSQVLANDSPTNAFVDHDHVVDLVVSDPEVPIDASVPFPSENDFVALAETVHSNIAHVGTQFDALGHIGIGEEFFNDNTFTDVFSPTGLNRLGVEDVPPIFTRGVLVDIAAYKGVEMLGPTYEITPEDLQGALARQSELANKPIEIRSGDVVLFHTGWGALYESDPEAFAATQPGLGVDVAKELAALEVVMVGADNVFVDVFPNPNPNLLLPVHQELLTKNGIYLLEVVKTDGLAQDQVYEFAFVFSAVRLEGGTGSPAHPFAIT